MRVLLLGGTGNLGSRCIPAFLAHEHIVTLYVRNPAKLQLLLSPAVLKKTTIVTGDATDSEGIKKAILAHNIEAVINVAGTQVKPGEEPLLPKIAKAVTDAAVAVRKERGIPLRAWLVSGLSILEYPGTPNSRLLQDYLPGFFYARVSAHEGTRKVVEAVRVSDLRWSLICVAMMEPANPNQGLLELLDTPSHHNLVLQAKSPPAWKNTWLIWIPFVGMFLNFLVVVLGQYKTKYEDVADFLSEDLESGSEQWIGMRVGMKDKAKIKAS
ncbi:hypothetical protein D0Z07_8896 [Hyphodiscus hymeniophilus]|uniref:NAD(P)-binding domain-containing protein n=1 Tax=Hyphodiscus hymeniophilus TaxID=353542 RepID=A0A9P6SKG2_9HELO|nr:hypothetical protein D0Z07_8896 [Hyphodiscus hymeniophilus]